MKPKKHPIKEALEQLEQYDEGLPKQHQHDPSDT